MKNHYEYSPLPDDSHIRVLELLPGHTDHTIPCILHSLPLDQATDTYEAISYVWGDEGDTCEILVDRARMSVTQNLADALRALKLSDKPRRLWADAVCINQKDDKEKGYPLRLMGDVYRCAKQVVVWLGRDIDGIAQQCFEHLLAVFRILSVQPPQNRDAVMRAKLTNTSGWKGLGKMLSRPWFQPTWVVQEAAVAKRCILMCGQYHLDMLHLASVCYQAIREKSLTERYCSSIMAFNDIVCLGCGLYPSTGTWKDSTCLVMLPRIRGGYTWSVAHVLNAGRSLKATKGVDHVYAFLGNPVFNDLHIEPDYTKSATQVFTEVACAMLSFPRDAPHVLSFINHSSDDDVRVSNLPSWVPNWSNPGHQEAALSSPRF